MADYTRTISEDCIVRVLFMLEPNNIISFSLSCKRYFTLANSSHILEILYDSNAKSPLCQVLQPLINPIRRFGVIPVVLNNKFTPVAEIYASMDIDNLKTKVFPALSDNFVLATLYFSTSLKNVTSYWRMELFTYNGFLKIFKGNWENFFEDNEIVHSYTNIVTTMSSKCKIALVPGRSKATALKIELWTDSIFLPHHVKDICMGPEKYNPSELRRIKLNQMKEENRAYARKCVIETSPYQSSEEE